MKTITVSKLKAGLSRYLRLASRGETVLVLDRNDPVAEIHAVRAGSADPWQRLAAGGGVKLGTQDWGRLKITPLGRQISVQQILDEIREDRS